MEEIVPLNSSTRERILEAAGEVFAEVGFRCATVRRICERAGVNVAAINYHFRSKEELYYEVLKYWHEFAVKKYPPLLGVGEDAPAEEQLRAFILSLLLRMLDKGKPAWFGKVMARCGRRRERMQNYQRCFPLNLGEGAAVCSDTMERRASWSR